MCSTSAMSRGGDAVKSLAWSPSGLGFMHARQSVRQAVQARPQDVPHQKPRHEHCDDNERHTLDAAEHVMYSLDIPTETVGDRVADADRVWHKEHGAAEVRDEEAPERQPYRASERPSEHTEPHDEACDENGDYPVMRDEAFGTREPLNPEARRKTLEPGPAETPPDPIADVVPDHGARDPDREQRRPPQPADPDEIPSHHQDRLLRHRHADVAEHDHE